MLVLKKYEVMWNKRIKEWGQDPEEYFKNDDIYKLYNGKEKTELEILGLPEPYLGDIYGRCSAILLSLNPGGLLPEGEQVHPKGKFILDGAVENYCDWAKSWYYINHTKNLFWKNKREWIDRRVSEENKLPFGIELIPYHSKKWGKLCKNEDALKYIEKNILNIAEKKINDSQFQHIVAIGKDYADIFEALNFELQIEVNEVNYMDQLDIEWPKKKDGEPRIRKYNIWKSPNGTTYFQTHAPGSNKAPSKDFLQIETEIIRKLNDK